MSMTPTRRSLLWLALLSFALAIIFAVLAWYSATASTIILVRLWHDQDGTGTVSPGDIPAIGVTVEVTEQCTGSVCAASPAAYVVVTDANGYASLELQPGTAYSIDAPCMTMTVRAAEVSGQGVQEMTTCRPWRLWLPVVER